MLLGIGLTPSGLLILLFVALLVFGRRLPELMLSAGKSVTEFKKGLNDKSDDTTPPKS